MKFDHKVKYNGKWYMPGEEITEAEQSASDFSRYMNPPEEKLPFTDDDFEETKPYNKTEINRMPAAELKNLAKEYGVDGAEEMTGADLKKILIKKLGL